jgi:hypothetical protein
LTFPFDWEEELLLIRPLAQTIDLFNELLRLAQAEKSVRQRKSFCGTDYSQLATVIITKRILAWSAARCGRQGIVGGNFSPSA